jgi:hypothetical protein
MKVKEDSSSLKLFLQKTSLKENLKKPNLKVEEGSNIYFRLDFQLKTQKAHF